AGDDAALFGVGASRADVAADIHHAIALPATVGADKPATEVTAALPVVQVQVALRGAERHPQQCAGQTGFHAEGQRLAPEAVFGIAGAAVALFRQVVMLGLYPDT